MPGPTPPARPPLRSRLRRLAREAFLLAITLLAVRVGLVEAYHVPTASMEPTVLSGDRLLIDKVTLGARTPDWVGIPLTGIGRPVPALKLPGLRSPEPGDVVVVRGPLDARTPLMKRVVAIGGETLSVRDGVVYVGGARRDFAPSVPPGPAPPGIRRDFGPYRVPDGQVFLVGDNRDVSLDSRYFGPVAEDKVIGVVRAVLWSWDPEGHTLRWRRSGHAVR